MWRDFAIALSLSNLCFIGEWRWLLIPSHSFYYYHYKVPPPPTVYLAVVLDVLLLAAVFLIVATIVRRSRSDRIKKYARVAFILILSVPLYGLFSQVDSHGIRQLLLPLLGDDMVPRLLLTIPLTAALFVTLVSLVKMGKARKVAVTLLLVLVPFVLVTFLQAGFMAMRYGRTEPGSQAQPVAREVLRKGPRVLWFVFDELDFRTVFSERPPTVELKELDRLVSESLFASNAFPPAQETFLSMPALTTGKLVSGARRISPEELMIKFGDENEAVPWSEQPNIFSRARELGFETALFGWYHPYCRILGSSLTRCAWEGRVPLSRIKEESDQPAADSAGGLALNMYSFAVRVVRAVPLVPFIFKEKVDIEDLARKKHVSNFNIIYRQAVEATTDPALGLVLVHWPIPHPPNIYDRSENKLSVGPGRSYLDNLALMDRTIGDIRRIMEGKGTWENTVVLVTSDHWWKATQWKERTVWTQEDEATFRVETDRRIPFVLKMTGDGSGVTYTQQFNTVLTHDLLLAILRGELSDTKGVAAWLDQHRSIGRSPYDERSFRDAL